jgi:hypothetical protein
LIARVYFVRPEFQESGSWQLLHNNAPAHSSDDVPEFLVTEGIPVLSHPPYFPHSVLADFLLLPKLKIAMKGTRFKAVSSIQQTVMTELKAIWEEAFSRAFVRCMSDVNIARKWAGTILSHGINKYFLSFFVVFMASVRELNCHIVYVMKIYGKVEV